MTASSLSAADRERERALVTEHLPVVGYLVSELMSRVPPHVRRDDLVSAGLAALAQSARGYDASLGVPFARFASTRIRGALVDELRSTDWASRGARSRSRKLEQAHDELLARLGRRPTEAEVAAVLGVPVSAVDAVRDDVQRAVVMSLQGFAEGGGTVEEHLSAHVPGPEEEVLHAERLGYLHDAVAALPERLREVVTRYFLDEEPMSAIAGDLGVTESRVSQLRAEALRLLHAGLSAHLGAPSAPAVAAAPATGVAARRREAYVAAVATQSSLAARLAAGALVSGRAAAGVGVGPEVASDRAADAARARATA